MRRASFIICAVALVALCGAVVEWTHRAADAAYAAEFESYEHRDGKKEAEADLSRGEPKWKVSGLYRHYDEDSVRLKRLGVEIDWFADCIVSEAIVRYRYTYNSTIYSHFEALVGLELTEEVLGMRPVDPMRAYEEGG